MHRKSPGETWTLSDEQRQLHWSSSGLEKVAPLASNIGSNAIMVVHGGQLVFQWGDCALKTSTASIRKSVMNALIGMAVDRGMIDPELRLEALNIDDRSSLSAIEKTAKISDLLKSRSGIYHPSVYDTADGRPERGAHMPGQYWFYNNWDFNVLGTIFRRCTSLDIYQAFNDWLATPLQMQDYQPEDGFLLEGPESLHPVYKLRLSLRDLTRFGLLYAYEGCWQKQQVLSQNWIRISTTQHTDVSEFTDRVNHPGRGYGYLWWTATASGFCQETILGHACFYGCGYGGQYVVIFPQLDLVVAHNVAHVDQGITHEQMGEILAAVLAAL